MRSEKAKVYRRWYFTNRWKKLRADQLFKEPICQFDGCFKVATVADHIVAHRGVEKLFFNASNLQSLCKTCHDTHKQRIESRGYLTEVDDTGWPSDVNHPANRRNR